MVHIDVKGLIPGNDGDAAGVWDAGSYVNLTRDEEGEEVPVGSALDQGRACIWLEGRKVRGGYVLLDASLQGKGSAWLLIKMKDDVAEALRSESASGRG